jgi:hypothetical protein
MATHIVQIYNMTELREYIHVTICDHFQLQFGVFPMTEKILFRGGNPCGIYFCVQGPRAVRFTAIWETDRNQVLFYGPEGERIFKTQLIEAPELESAAA